jgi:hypothetical protein
MQPTKNTPPIDKNFFDLKWRALLIFKSKSRELLASEINGSL